MDAWRFRGLTETFKNEESRKIIRAKIRAAEEKIKVNKIVRII